MESIYSDWLEYERFAKVAFDPGELNFYRRHFQAATGPVLELGCGTGRVLLAAGKLSRQPLVGIDGSNAMLEGARLNAQRAGVPAKFIYGDMRQFGLKQKFGLFLITGNTLAHLLSIEEFNQCMECIRRHALCTANLIIDVFAPDEALLARSSRAEFLVCDYRRSSGERVSLTESVAYDSVTQINHVTWHFTTHVRRDSVSIQLRMYFPAELRNLLKSVGMSIVSTQTGFKGTETDNKKQIIVCRVIDSSGHAANA